MNIGCKGFTGILVLGLLATFLTLPTLSCTSESGEENRHQVVTLTAEEKEAWDATAVFLTGVFTIANADSLDSTVFFENFRANYDWIKNVFLPHLRGTPEHPWWECNEICVEMAKKLANGDKEREKELREKLSRYRIHERERSESSEDCPESQPERRASG